MNEGRVIRLLAIAPSGETYFVEIDGRTWLVRPRGAGDPQIVDPSVVERAVAVHGFQPEDRVFATPDELDAFRNDLAASIAPEVATRVESFDEEDVRRMLTVARRWLSADDARGVRLLRALLRAHAVRNAPDLLAEILDLLQRGSAVPVLVSPADTEKGRKAREQYQAPQAA